MNDSAGAQRRRGAAVVGAMLVALVVACDPGTTRPDLVPFPESQVFEVEGDRPTAIAALRDALVADSFPVSRDELRDAWLETPWFDALTLRPTGAQRLGPDVVKLRGWADPARPGNSLLVVELVYRPLADPSVPQRELDRPVPATDSIYTRVGTILRGIKNEIGFQGAGH